MSHSRLGFVGFGQMAQAICGGVSESEFGSSLEFAAYDPSPKIQDWIDSHSATVALAASNTDLLELADVIVLAVKPQFMAGVLEELDGKVGDRLVISIAGGIRMSTLTTGLGTDRVIRVMPNTPCLVGAGAAGFCAGDGATEEDRAFATGIFSSVGVVHEVTEPQLDAVTGLSGSGPAYVYLMIEALSDGGVRMGLPRPVATVLATQTVLGAAEMVKQTGRHPGELKDQVTSPGGTTITGIQALENGALRGTLMEAVAAATRRSEELGRAT